MEHKNIEAKLARQRAHFATGATFPAAARRRALQDLLRALEEDERELFAAYQKARYAGNRADGEISGEAVGRMRALNERVRSRRIREEK